MNKERLEEIKNRRKKHDMDILPVWAEDVDWLIKRVELLGKLREEDSTYYNELLTRVREQNKRYREALEFYANEEHYKEKLISEAQYDADGICISNDEYAPPIIYFDSGEKARKSLKGE